MAEDPIAPADTTLAPPPRPRGSSLRTTMAGIVVAFLLGGAAVGYVAWEGLFPFARTPAPAPAPATADGNTAAAPARMVGAAPMNEAVPPTVPQLPTNEAQIGTLEARLAQLELRAAAASDNAARAEGLLIAVAARRALDKGAPLGVLNDQLRLRFADAQPNAVATIIAGGANPVTLDQLLSGLSSMAPDLTTASGNAAGWQRLKFELANLFVVRREDAPSPAPASRLERARALLIAGQIDAAITEVQSLPGAKDAGDWLAAARRYSQARAALDLIETTALLDTRALKNGQGQAVTGAAAGQ